jgi:hypothetical protein
MITNGLDHGANHLDRVGDVELRARQQLSRIDPGRTQIKAAQHPPSLVRRG